MDFSELQFFAGKRVFITGHTGFKGTWLTQIMILAGASVCGYSLAKIDGESHFNGLGIKDLITHIEGDIRDEEILTEANAYGLRAEVQECANKFLADGFNHHEAYSMAFDEWVK